MIDKLVVMSHAKESPWIVVYATTTPINMEEIYFLACLLLVDGMRYIGKGCPTIRKHVALHEMQWYLP